MISAEYAAWLSVSASRPAVKAGISVFVSMEKTVKSVNGTPSEICA